MFVPFIFDQAIGYWTGEPDRQLLARALLSVPEDPAVEREVGEDRVILRGPSERVTVQADLLREQGLQ